MGIELKLEQSLQLTQGQLQSLDILTLTNQELEGFLTEEYLENPLLECSVDKQGDLIKNLESFYEQGATFGDTYMSWDGSGTDVSEDTDRTGDVRGKEEHDIDKQIMAQLDAEQFTEDEWDTIRVLTQLLDEKGFFPYTSEDVASIIGVPAKEVERLLSLLRTLEPIGIFAYDIADCLSVQLKAQGIEDDALYEMIDTCMEDVLKGQYAAVTRKLHIPTAKVRDYIRLIGTLNPRPLMNIEGGEETQYIVPDVIARMEDGAWQVVLNDRWMGDYRLDGYYLKMMKEATDPALKNYFKEKLQRAHFLIDAVERRRTTIVRITEAILHLQSAYFLHGETLKPMTLDDIAVRCDIHASTVSRAIKGKYISCKRVVPIRSLFCTQAADNDVSADEIGRAIRDIVQEEDKAKPYSDRIIEEKLAERGLFVKRRTIAKYRTQLGIPDSRQRVFL